MAKAEITAKTLTPATPTEAQKAKERGSIVTKALQEAREAERAKVIQEAEERGEAVTEALRIARQQEAVQESQAKQTKVVDDTPPVPDRPGGQVATVDGERQYIPGSTMYEKGFRTEKEWFQARGKQATIGLHEGKYVPEDSIVLTDPRGKPIARYSPKQISSRGIDPAYIAPYIEKGQYRIPYKTPEGKEVFVEPATHNLITSGRLTPEQHFTTLMEVGVYPKGSIFIAKTGGYIPADQVELIREQAPELHKILVEKGYDAYVSASRELERRGIATEAEQRGTIVSRALLPDFIDSETGNLDIVGAAG
ncbi:MAG: hypothetical protein KKD44_26915, partial [Proteobacteria bacterium]|nr:hypothetical protein [Pseudomonadota bacterium]